VPAIAIRSSAPADAADADDDPDWLVERDVDGWLLLAPDAETFVSTNVPGVEPDSRQPVNVIDCAPLDRLL